MQVRVNGREMELPDGCTVETLLQKVEVDAKRVAVERNQDIVPKKTYAACVLAPGDQIEIVTFVGGG
jgi:thiamine biosynthesis protein ThiS